MQCWCGFGGIFSLFVRKAKRLAKMGSNERRRSEIDRRSDVVKHYAKRGVKNGGRGEVGGHRSLDHFGVVQGI